VARTLDPRRLLLPGALATLVLAGALLGALGEATTDDLRQGDGLAELDHPVATWLSQHRTGWLTTIMRTITTLGSPLGVTITTGLVAAAVCWRTRRLSPVLLAAIVLGGAELLETVTKHLVGRPRPPLSLRVPGVSASGFSFPSGHATLAAAGYGLIAVLLTRYAQRTAARAAVWAGAATAAAAVGFSRLYLGAHWLSDVVAGWLIGAAWLGLVVTTATLLTRRVQAARTVDEDG